jgi:hypothetical protein
MSGKPTSSIAAFFSLMIATVAYAQPGKTVLRCHGDSDVEIAQVPGLPFVGSVDYHYYHADIICKESPGTLDDLSCIGQYEGVEGKNIVFSSYRQNGGIKAKLNVPNYPGGIGEKEDYLACETQP